MTFTLDSRIPVILAGVEQAGADDFVLREGHPGLAGFLPGPSAHGATCACCAPRGPAGRALAALLQARARGEVTFFRRVVACVTSEAGRAGLLDALDRDPVASACFRLAG